MKMKSGLLFAPTVMAVIALVNIVSASTPRTTPTTGGYGQNLEGKMFTLSSNRGGIYLYPPNYSSFSSPWLSTTPYPRYHRPPYTTRPYFNRPYFNRPYFNRPYTTRPYFNRPYTTRPYFNRPYTTRPYFNRPPATQPTTTYTTTTQPTTTYTTTTPYTTTTTTYTTTTPYTTSPPWTSAPPTRGVSVCLRYITDDSTATIFTLSPRGTPLRLRGNYAGGYWLDVNGYNSLSLQANLLFWHNIGEEIWTRVCLTVDSMTNVAQMFQGSSISIRKMLRVRYVWSGEPVIDISGFDGQVTDVQMWDYPLSYNEILSYMSQYSSGGSVLSWSSISYSLRGNTLLEDVYERQANQPISSKRRGRRPEGKKRSRRIFNVGERKERRGDTI